MAVASQVHRPAGSRRALTAPCLLLCLSLCLQGRALAAPGEFERIASWLRPSSTTYQRVWGSALLNTSILHWGNMFQVHHLFDKLKSGKPIKATALGSSLIQDAAGCFHSTSEALWQFPGVVPNPNIYATQGQELRNNDAAIERCKGGFMTTVMENINNTWPHSQHIFFNNGKGGANLDSIAKAGCIETHVPEDVDIVILDPITNVGSVEGAERLLRLYLRKPSRPLVIILSNGRNCMNRGWDECAVRCIQALVKGTLQDNSPCTDPSMNDLYGIKESQEWYDSAMKPFQELAIHYNVPHLSIHHPLIQIMNGPRLTETPEDTPTGTPEYPPEGSALSRAEMIANYLMDSVHLRKNRLGVMLVADILLHYLWASQERLKSMTESQRTSLHYEWSNVPVYKGAKAVYMQRCYGTNLKHALSHLENNMTASSDLSEADKVKNKILELTPGDHFQGFAQPYVQGANEQNEQWVPEDQRRLHLEGQRAFPPLQIITQQGWTLQVAYKNPNGEIKIKPGWISNSTGAHLMFQVNTSWAGTETVGDPQVVITYVKSYAGWGQVLLACNNCMCNSTVLDAHWEKKHSLNQYHLLNVTQHEQCQVSLTILGSTSSTGHQWKLVHVLARIEEKMVSVSATTAARMRRLDEIRPVLPLTDMPGACAQI